MNLLDIGLIVLLLIGAVKGYNKGLFMELCSIIALILGVIGAFRLLDIGLDFVNEYFQLGNIAYLIVFGIIFLCILVTVHGIAKLIKRIFDYTLLGGLDNLAGAIFGAVRWTFVAGVFLLLMSHFTKQMPEVVQNSILSPLLIDSVRLIVDIAFDYAEKYM